jgi:hypothetical protein
MAVGAVALGGSGSRGSRLVAVQGVVKHYPPLFIGVREAVRGDILSSELQWPTMEVHKKIPVWTPAGGIRG